MERFTSEVNSWKYKLIPKDITAIDPDLFFWFYIHS